MRKGKHKEIETEEDAAEEEVEAEEEEEEEGGLPTIPEAYEDPEFVVMYTAIMKAASRAGIIIEDSFPSVRHRSHPSSPLSLPSHPLPLPPSPPSHSLPSPPLPLTLSSLSGRVHEDQGVGRGHRHLLGAQAVHGRAGRRRCDRAHRRREPGCGHVHIPTTPPHCGRLT
jgi:hypothetical protein